MDQMSDMEIIRRQMNAARSNMAINDPSVVSIGASKEKETLVVDRDAQQEQKLFKTGYTLVYNWAKDHSKEGKYSSKDDPSLPEVNEDDFKIDQDQFNQDFWKEHVNSHSPLQNLVKYSDNVILHAYTIGLHFYNNKDHQKAISIFEFLCILEPDIPAFRIAKGLALEGNNDVAEASTTFEKCIENFPEAFDAYLGMIRCSEKTGEVTKIKELLEAAVDNPTIGTQAKDALEYLASKTGKGG